MIRTSSLVMVSRTSEPCGECGEACQKCLNKNSLDLHHEIEELRAKVSESNNRMIQMESDFTHSQHFIELENLRIQDDLGKLRDRYDRLMDSHKKLQRLNHNLECKLLTVVEKLEQEKKSLSDQILSLNHQLLEARINGIELQEELERCRQDCNIAVHLLQCKPSHFIPHKLNSFPPDLQQRLRSQLSQKQIIEMDESAQFCSQVQPPQQLQTKTIRVPMATFPPTAIVYSVNQTDFNGSGSDEMEAVIPTAIVARVLAKPDGGIRKSGRVVICPRCLTEKTVTDTRTQTDWISKADLCSNSRRDEKSLEDDCKRTHLANSRHDPHPKIHRLRHNSIESQI